MNSKVMSGNLWEGGIVGGVTNLLLTTYIWFFTLRADELSPLESWFRFVYLFAAVGILCGITAGVGISLIQPKINSIAVIPLAILGTLGSWVGLAIIAIITPDLYNRLYIMAILVMVGICLEGILLLAFLLFVHIFTSFWGKWRK